MIQEITEEIFQYVINKNEFEIHFQPIVSIGKGRIIGMEALLRTSFNGEKISPEHLFAYAKKNEQLIDLDKECHRHATYEYSKNNNEILLFLNIEASLLDSFVNNISRFVSRLDDYGISRDSVVLEINERRMNKIDILPELSKACKKEGLLVALDDVGAGHSNLYRIIEVNPDIIKIDRSVITNININFRKHEVLSAICDLGDKIGAVIVAEGTETQDEVIECLACGVDWFQGFFFDKAMQIELIKTKSYINKCRKAAELYKKKADMKMSEHTTLIHKQKKVFYDLLEKLELLDSTSDYNETIRLFFEKRKQIECFYLLSCEGIQITDTIFNPNAKNKNKKMFSAMKKGDYHISKQYYYYVERNPQKQYISSIYVSQAIGNFCRTISGKCNFPDMQNILCVDFLVE